MTATGKMFCMTMQMNSMVNLVVKGAKKISTGRTAHLAHAQKSTTIDTISAKTATPSSSFRTIIIRTIISNVHKNILGTREEKDVPKVNAHAANPPSIFCEG